MKDNPTVDKKKYPKREYMSVSVEYFPEKRIIIWKMINCCECGGENIFSVKLDDKYLDYLKEVLKRGEKHNIPPEDKDFDKIL